MNKKYFSKMCFEVAYDKFLDYKADYKNICPGIKKLWIMLRYEGLGWWLAGASVSSLINFFLN